MKSKDEMLADCKKTFGPGIAQRRKGWTWRHWTIGACVLAILGLIAWWAHG